jgi:hypothetical protein
MKKATLTIGLFTLVMVLTSFANPTTAIASNIETPVITSIDGTGNQVVVENKKADTNESNFKGVTTSKIKDIDGSGSSGQDAGGSKKVD